MIEIFFGKFFENFKKRPGRLGLNVILVYYNSTKELHLLVTGGVSQRIFSIRCICLCLKPIAFILNLIETHLNIMLQFIAIHPV